MSRSEGEYQAEERETLAEVPGLRVRVLSLAHEQSVPWHYHNHITDTFICLRGPMYVATRGPDEEHELQAGDTFAVGPGTPHRVTCAAETAVRFVIIQGVGDYDYVGLPDGAAEHGDG
jgi:quercetin dioxygenase-like cupin family protein